MTIALVVSIVLLASALAVFLVAVRRRWLAHVQHGFLLTLLLALAGTGVGGACVLAIWGAGVGRDLLLGEMVDELRNVGGVIEAEIHEGVRYTQERLGTLAEQLAPQMARGERDRIQETVRTVHAFNRRFLQINVMDRDGTVMASSGAQGAVEPPNRIAIAFNLEGKPFASDAYLSPVFKTYVLYLSAPMRQGDEVVGAVSVRYDLQDYLSRVVGETRFGKTAHLKLVTADGRVLAHPVAARIGADMSADLAVQRAQAGQTGWVIGDGGRHGRLRAYRPVKSPAVLDPKPWALLVEMDEDEAMAGVHELWDDFAVAAAIVGLACLLVAWQVSRALGRPITEMLAMIRRVSDGDLAARTGLSGHDEIGRMGAALDVMAHGLQERDRIKEVFGRYVTTQVSEEVLKGQITLGGSSRRVTILFSDIRNFTTMSEQMSPEQVVAFLNDYFSEMVEAVFEHDGVLDKFIGDGMMAIFGSLDDKPDHARRAVLAALRMKARLAKLNGDRSVGGKPPIAIGIGIHTDDVIVGNIGSHRRLEYTVIGDGVNTCARVESVNKDFGTTILITESTYEVVRDDFECRPMPEAHLKGKLKNPQLYEVVSTRVGVPAG